MGTVQNRRCDDLQRKLGFSYQRIPEDWLPKYDYDFKSEQD
jgi:hypothetical protein